MGTTVERRHPLAKCEECPWREKSEYAGATGPEDSDILVVGEAPGSIETQSGVPFTGPSGQLLDRVLAHHKIDRGSIRLTNVAACHPPYSPGKGSVTPPKEVIKACKPRLDAELEGKTALLLLGNTAAQTCTGDSTKITAFRQGPPKDFDGVKVIPSVHPAFCLRSSDAFPFLVKDVGKLAQAINPHRRNVVEWTPPDYRAFEDPTDAVRAMEEVERRFDTIAVDIECGVEKDTSFTHPDVLLCVGISYATNKAIVIGENALRDRRVREVLDRLVTKSLLTIWHNGKYDYQVLMRDGVCEEPPEYWLDTMLAHYALDERAGIHGLEGMASEHLGAPDWKNVIKKYTGKDGSYALVPREILYQYCAYDVAQTFRLWFEVLEEKLKDQGMRRVHDMLVTDSRELVYVEYDGMEVDIEYLDTLQIALVDQLGQLEEQLSPWVNNPRSPKQLIESFRTHFGIQTGSTAVGVLESHYERSTGDLRRFLELLLEHRKQSKLYGTYVKGIRKRLINGRIYPTYLLHGTVFGRLAARNPNIHNIPRGPKIKRLFVAGPGKVFVYADYSQAELRVMACEARDPFLRDVFADPERDIHNEVSDTLYGAGKWNKEHRVRTKAFVFGSAYGREPYSIATEFNLSVGEAERLYRDFMGMIPHVVEWRKQVHETVFSSGTALQTHFGRKRRFWLITRDNKADVSKESLAFIPQSTAADLCLLALADIRRQFGWSENAPRVRNTVHDSILVECDAADADEVARIMSGTMQRVAAEQYSDFVPFVAEAEIGSHYGEF